MPIASSGSICGQNTSIPTPFRKMLRTITRKVPHRIHQRHPLHRLGHVGNRKGEARKQHRRKEEEERRHHRLLLRLAEGRNQQADAERVHQEQPGGQQQQQQARRGSAPRTKTRRSASPAAPRQIRSARTARVLPRMNSAGVIGVTMICSIVPISFSRTTAMLVSSSVPAPRRPPARRARRNCGFPGFR